MSNHRYSKFWWQDWQGDKALQCCSMAARGFWMELLCLAHEGTPYGHIVVNGKSPSSKTLAKMLRQRSHDVIRWLSELEENGVFSRTSDGTIYSRRMVKDIEKTAKFKEYGKRGGNPKLKPTDNPGGYPP